MLSVLLGVLARPARALADRPVHPAGSVSTTHVPPPVPARAQRFWNRGFRPLSAWDYVNAGVSVTAVVLEATLLEPIPPQVQRVGPILFDRAVRDALRDPTSTGRHSASIASWVFMVALMAYPIAVDVPVAWARGGSWLAWQLLWQDTIVIASATAIDIAIRDAIGRGRPDVAECIEHGGQNCASYAEAGRSFPGGHMATATASAALICTQHLHLHLYGGPWDGATCASALASSVAVGVLRIVADAHNATDILAGGLLGGLIGGLAPSLMWYPHHRHDPARTPPAAMVAPYPIVLPGGGGGIGVTGVMF